MSIPATVRDKQSMEIGVHGPDGANRMFITTGKLSVNLSAADNTATGSGSFRNETFTALIDPPFSTGQFRRAVATASLATISDFDNEPAERDGASWSVQEAQADFDDESGKVELRVGLAVNARGKNSSASIAEVAFQVTTLAKV